MVKNDEEIVSHILTSDTAFHSLRGAVFDGQEWLATGEFEDLLGQLEVQREAHASQQAETDRQRASLQTQLTALDQEVASKSAAFEEVQAKHAAKQALDRRVADLDQPQRVMLNGQEIVALLSQTRRSELDNISLLQQEIAALKASSEALGAQLHHRSELYEKLVADIAEFRHAAEGMDPEPVKKSRR